MEILALETRTPSRRELAFWRKPCRNARAVRFVNARRAYRRDSSGDDNWEVILARFLIPKITPFGAPTSRHKPLRQGCQKSCPGARRGSVRDSMEVDMKSLKGYKTFIYIRFRAPGPCLKATILSARGASQHPRTEARAPRTPPMRLQSRSVFDIARGHENVYIYGLELRGHN